jgi:hypothetical protein
MILSKAASTAADGPAVGAGVVRFVTAGDGEASGLADLVTVFGVGVGVGLASTVRVRLEGEVVVLLCATARARLAKDNRGDGDGSFHDLSSSDVKPKRSVGTRAMGAGCAAAKPNVPGPLSQTRQTSMARRPARSAWCARHL